MSDASTAYGALRVARRCSSPVFHCGTYAAGPNLTTNVSRTRHRLDIVIDSIGRQASSIAQRTEGRVGTREGGGVRGSYTCSVRRPYSIMKGRTLTFGVTIVIWPVTRHVYCWQIHSMWLIGIYLCNSLLIGSEISPLNVDSHKKKIALFFYEKSMNMNPAFILMK